MDKQGSFWHLGRVSFRLSLVAMVFALSVCAVAGDWPTYRGNVARTAVSAEPIVRQLHLQWQYIPTQKPASAWPEPAEEIGRTHSDNAYHVVASDGMAYFAESITNRVNCIDLASGKTKWSFYAEGPVRFAPTVYDGRLYFGSDDGYVYCLNAADGKIAWKYRPGPGGEKVIGNGRMISMWPVRTSVVVDDSTAYFAAGVFPYEGLYICALKADDGSVIWCNDTIGDRSHEQEFGGISPQGYPVVSKDMLYIPSGRAMPAVFDRQTGRFIRSLSPGGKRGGSWVLLDNDRLITGVDQSGRPVKAAYDAVSGKRRSDAFAWFPGKDIVVTDKKSYVLTNDGVYAIDRSVYADKTARASQAATEQKSLNSKVTALGKKLSGANEATGREIKKQIADAKKRIGELSVVVRQAKESSFQWNWKGNGFSSLLLAGDTVFVGGPDEVVGVDAKTGKKVWSRGINGNAVGLAAADGRLLVSSDLGIVSCFGPAKQEALITRTKVDHNPYTNIKDSVFYENAARRIVADSAQDKGFCLVLNCGSGQLAYEIARQTSLQIVGLEKDPQALAKARLKLDKAGLLGNRIVVESWDIEDLPDYFANLVVSDGMLFSRETTVPSQQIHRVLRPYGGVAMLGSSRQRGEVTWQKIVRGELIGSGEWTHQYGDPQNTACSNDRLVSGPLGLQWYGEPGPKYMLDRHSKSAAPLAMNGRLFIQGGEVVMAYDAYNGVCLWERRIPGAVRARVDVDAGNLALSQDSLYVAANDKCYRLDQETGRTLRIYELPDTGNIRWGYVAYVDGMLYGSVATGNREEYAGRYKEKYPDENVDASRAAKRSGANWHPVTNFPGWENYNNSKGSLTGNIMTCNRIFSMDPETGEVIWEYEGSRIANITLSIDDGRIYFAESDITDDQRKQAVEQREKLIDEGIYEDIDAKWMEQKYVDIRNVLALDATNGKKLWSTAVDLTGCCGDALGTAVSDGTLLLFGNVGNHDAWRFQQDQLKYRRVTALSVSDGNMAWSRPLNYRTRPLIVGAKLIVEPGAVDVRTGRTTMRTHPITGQEVPWEFLRPGHTCAITSASADALFYRSASTAMYDLNADSGVTLFGGVRPGCWLNMIPACGVLLFPEASAGCTCSYPIRCSVVLRPKSDRSRPWTVFVTPGAITPVKHLAINLGAPADMMDHDGNLWFGYPNPNTVYAGNHFPNYGIKFDLKDKTLDEMGYFSKDFKGDAVDGTDKPWLFTSGCVGLTSCTITLQEDSIAKTASYTVRLGFAGSDLDKAGQRIFDVVLQNKVVKKDFDIVAAAGKTNKAIVIEYKGVDATKSLKIELVPKVANPNRTQAPILNFIEVQREDAIVAATARKDSNR